MTNELDVILLSAIRAQNAGNCDQTFPLPRTSDPARLHRRHCTVTLSLSITLQKAVVYTLTGRWSKQVSMRHTAYQIKNENAYCLIDNIISRAMVCIEI